MVTVTSAAPSTETSTLVRRAGLAVVVVGVFGGVFPYFSNGLGLPIDGAPDGAMTLWRTVIHLVPGVLGVVAGVGLLVRPWLEVSRWSRLGVAVGGWFAIGPYIWGLVQPADAVGTGGLAGTMTMGDWSSVIMPSGPGPMAPVKTVTCAFTMGVDHWAVGALVVLASLVALGAGARRGPLAGLSS